MGIGPIGFLAIHLASVLTVACGLRAASVEEFPFQVSIQDISGNKHLGGGVILTEKWILASENCLRGAQTVRVAYGSADSSQPLGIIESKQIWEDHQSESPHRLVLIELKEGITVSEKAKRAQILYKNVTLSNMSAKFSGWKSLLHTHQTLNVVDEYCIKVDDCVRPTGTTVKLHKSEICGYEDQFPNFNSLLDLGSVVSKRGIVLGLLVDDPQSPASPLIFAKVSEYQDWIEHIVKPDDRGEILWVDQVPKDSASSVAVKSLSLMFVLSLIARLI